jgi:hypothetical protein
MDYYELLNRIIDDGIAAAKEDYIEGPKLEGSIEGFEACRDKLPEKLKMLLEQATAKTHQAMMDDSIANEDYWRIRCHEAEIEWVCNCISAALMNEGKPVIVQPTAGAVMKVAEIVGVAEAI